MENFTYHLNSSKMAKLLIIEDNKKIAQGLKITFNREEVILATSINDAKKTLKENRFDIILLDLNLPDGDGLEYHKNHLSDLSTPVVMLTARDLEKDELAGLNAGAEDYITKPFAPALLRKRVEIILKRNSPSLLQTIQSGSISIDINQNIAFFNNEPIQLSSTEFNLLSLLIQNKNRILLKEVLMEKLWADEPVDDNTLSVNIRRLRKKLEATTKQPTVIKTIHGMGYSWRDET